MALQAADPPSLQSVINDSTSIQQWAMTEPMGASTIGDHFMRNPAVLSDLSKGNSKDPILRRRRQAARAVLALVDLAAIRNSSGDL